MISVDMQVKGLAELQAKLGKLEREVVDAVDRALVVVGQRGFDWLESNAPEASGLYKRSIELDVSPSGDVKLSVKAGHAKPLEATTGIFNKMIKATMSREEIAKEIDRQMELIR